MQSSIKEIKTSSLRTMHFCEVLFTILLIRANVATNYSSSSEHPAPSVKIPPSIVTETLIEKGNACQRRALLFGISLFASK